MNYAELLELVKTQEGYTLEFKESLSTSIGKEICAFANASGGKIILGIKDNGSVSGYNLTNKDKSIIQDIARNMDPSLHLTIEKVSDLAVIYVPEGKEKPYTINGHFYLRQGANSQQLRRDEIRSLFQKENLIRFDRKANPDFMMKKDFDNEKYKLFVSKAGIDGSIPKEHVLHNLGLITEGKLNNAGVLFFSRKSETFFTNSTITCVLYGSKTKSKILDKQDFGDDFISNFNNAVLFALKTLRTEYVINKVEREELPEIQEIVLRELIINAMTHREYFSEGRVLIEIYSDRFEISNPGGLLFKKSDFGRISLSRNPLLVDLVHRLKFVERVGSGILRIKELMKDEITFDLNSDWFFVKIRRNVPENVPENAPENVPENRLKKIRELIKKDSTISILGISNMIKVNEKTIKRDLEKLKEKHLLRRIGPKKGGAWELLD
jgi:ATP-dependent DNA helicase RecG